MSAEQCKHFQALIEVIQSSLPIQSIYADMAVNPKQISQNDEYDKKQIQDKFRDFAEYMEAKKSG